MSVAINTFCNGRWKQNCYVIENDFDEALVIDPGGAVPEIEEYLSKKNLTPLAILNTHAHYDHLGGVAPLMAKYSIPFYLHPQDKSLMRQANLYRMLFDSRESICLPESSIDLDCGLNALHIGHFEITFLHTPGHTPGGTCISLGDNLFTGDTLLSSGPGRTDLPGGNKGDIEASIRLISKLSPSTQIWPGHGRPFFLNKIIKEVGDECKH